MAAAVYPPDLRCVWVIRSATCHMSSARAVQRFHGRRRRPAAARGHDPAPWRSQPLSRRPQCRRRRTAVIQSWRQMSTDRMASFRRVYIRPQPSTSVTLAVLSFVGGCSSCALASHSNFTHHTATVRRAIALNWLRI